MNLPAAIRGVCLKVKSFRKKDAQKSQDNAIDLQKPEKFL